MQPSILFSWSAPAGRTDGTALTPEETSALTYRLYENGELAVDTIGELEFTLLMEGKPHGQYTYTATAVEALRGLESPPTEPVIINFIPPAAPTNFVASWIES